MNPPRLPVASNNPGSAIRRDILEKADIGVMAVTARCICLGIMAMHQMM